jgi:hypothetical protein
MPAYNLSHNSAFTISLDAAHSIDGLIGLVGRVMLDRGRRY